MTETLKYKAKWQDSEFNKLFIGFKAYILSSEEACARQCAEIIAPQLPDRDVRVLELGAGDGLVSLAFLEVLRSYRRIAGYTAIDISPELVMTLESRVKDFKKYADEVGIECADAAHFVPAHQPHLIVAFNSWYGIQTHTAQRYLSLLAPAGLLAIVLSSRDSITIDLTTEFIEPMYASEDLYEWLKDAGISLVQHEKIVSQHLQKSSFLQGESLNPKGEIFFRYLLRRPEGSLDDIIPYLLQKPELYFKVPQDLMILRG